MIFTTTQALRLDIFLSKELNQTRNQIAQLIKKDCITVDGKETSKPGLKLKPDQVVGVSLPKQEESKALKINFDVEIIFEDEHILVINKPTNLTVHPAPSVKDATLVDWLKHKGIRLSTISGEERHGIVHRLDKGTSGVMVVAKSNEAHEKLSLQLQDKSMGRYYIAVIEPPLKENHTIVDKAIGRSANNRLKMACVEGRKEAKTLFAKMALSKDERQEIIACKLFTGRTHQIRVHLESLNRHILGDHLYGSKSNIGKIQRILLHAYILYLKHPITDQEMQFVANVPDDYTEYLKKYFEMEIIDEKLDVKNFNNFFNSDNI